MVEFFGIILVGCDFAACLDDPGSLGMQYLSNLMKSLTKDQFLDRIPDQSLIEGDLSAWTEMREFGPTDCKRHEVRRAIMHW